MGSFETPPSAEESRDQEREVIVEKVRKFFEEKIADFASKDQQFGNQKWRSKKDTIEEKKLKYIIESCRVNDYEPALLYLDNEIEYCENEYEFAVEYEYNDDGEDGEPSEDMEERWNGTREYWQAKLVEAKALRASLIVK